jgi:hypothetical protein
MESESNSDTELLPLSTIRVETALSRYPVHRLARRGSIKIEVNEQNGLKAETSLKWKVSYNSDHGQPGPLAYKIDTLIINRRIEEAPRPVPRLIKLGSLNDICRELGISQGKNVVTVKNALHQNASAYITAKIQYRQADGTERTLEAGFTRYSVVFTGEKLPDGRKADGVYIILNDSFSQVINGAITRPLDYAYLQNLPPAPQRFYELLSYQMYAALKYDRSRAKLIYSDFCAHAPQTRYTEWERVRIQMSKVHRPHRASGYIAAVDFQQTTDADGNPDWIMLYQPGPKARAEFRAFTKRGGPTVVEVEPRDLPPPEPGSELERELIKRGVTASAAAELAIQYTEERIRAQIERLDWLLDRKSDKIDEPAAYLVQAIKNDYAAPKGFISKAERERRHQAKLAKARQEADECSRQREQDARHQNEREEIETYINKLDAVERTKLEAAALADASTEARQNYEDPALSRFRESFMLGMLRDHVRRLIGARDQSSAAA